MSFEGFKESLDNRNGFEESVDVGVGSEIWGDDNWELEETILGSNNGRMGGLCVDEERCFCR